MNNKTLRKRSAGDRCSPRRAVAALAQTHAARQQRPGRRAAGRPARHRRSRSSRRTTSRSACSPAPTRRRTSARAGSTALRLGYHITEDFFVEGVYGQTKVSDELFRQILPGGIFAADSEKLSYYNLSVGYNLLPGRDLHRRHARQAVAAVRHRRRRQHQVRRPAQADLQLRLRLPRLLSTDWVALQLDLRDHVFSLDLLGKRESTQNLELTGGLTVLLLSRAGHDITPTSSSARAPRPPRYARSPAPLLRRRRRTGVVGDRAGDRGARLHAARDGRPEPAPEGAARPGRDGQLLGHLVRPVPRRRCRT